MPRSKISTTAFLLLPLLVVSTALLAGCDDDSTPELGQFEGSYEYTAFSTDGPAVTLNGTLEITEVDSSRGTAAVSLDAQGQWAGVAIQVSLDPGARAFLDPEGGVLIQEEGTAGVGTGGGESAPFQITHTGALSEGGEIQGTFSLEIEGRGTTGGEFTAVRDP